MKYFSIIIIAILIFAGCANQLPPGGGPVDREPPQILRTFPEQGSINFNKNFVEFEFDEYINKGTVFNSIFISPYISDEIEIKWSGKKLRIQFPDQLKNNQTYVISLGTDISDLRGNKLKESFTLKFSTGEKIDEGEISGRVFDAKPDGVFIFFYLIDSVGKKIDYTLIKPDFVTQTSKDGNFKLIGLPNGIFRIIAIRDKMKNLVFNPDEDEIGLPVNDFILSDSLKVIKNVFFELQKIDTTRPILNSVKFEDLNHINLNFNEPIDLSNLNVSNFTLYDSLKNNSLNPAAFYLKDDKTIILVFDSLQKETDYQVRVDGVSDLSNNKVKSTMNFYTENIKDTIPLLLHSIKCNYSQNIMEYFQSEFYVKFNDYIKEEDFLSAVSITDTGNNPLKFSYSRVDSASFDLRLLTSKQKEKILVRLNLGRLKDLTGNSIDTVVVQQLETNSESEYSSISGFIKNRNLVNDELIVEAINTNFQKRFSTLVTNNSYQIKNLLPGSYFLRLGVTKKNLPRENFSNPFTYYPDTIKVKSRWPVTDVNFDAKNLIR